MKHLHDRFAVDIEPTAEQIKHEQARKADVHFERRKREIIPVVIQHDERPINPLGDALKGVRV